MNDNVICVPIDASIYNELVLRCADPNKDVTAWIGNVLSNYLQFSEDDPKWSDAYHQWRAGAKDLDAFADKYGDPKRGYQWGPLFLPNGTKISMNYRGRTHHAEVRREQVWYARDGGEEASYSPSELARVIANNTSRNAWRDLVIKRPSDHEWRLADELRRKAV